MSKSPAFRMGCRALCHNMWADTQCLKLGVSAGLMVLEGN